MVRTRPGGEGAAEDFTARWGFGGRPRGGAELYKDHLVLALVDDVEQAALHQGAIERGELAEEDAELDPVAEVAHGLINLAEAAGVGDVVGDDVIVAHTNLSGISGSRGG
jgi:hypothetical protein